MRPFVKLMRLGLLAMLPGLGGLAGDLRAEQTSAAEPDSVVGTWHTEGRESQVRLYPCGDSICGEIVALAKPTKSDGSPLLDSQNKDESLRSRPILGMQILGGFENSAPNRWTDGWGYDAGHGRTFYDVEMELLGPDELEIGGCVLWGLICQMQTWERVGGQVRSRPGTNEVTVPKRLKN